MAPTVSRLSRDLRSRLAPLYGEGEARAMVNLIWFALKGWDTTDQVIHADSLVSDYIIEQFERILMRLEGGEPLQYILGEARFYGMDLKVAPGVLIPRPETAELVDLIVDENRERKDLRVLDIGTGSGAIAIALQRNLPFSEVTAIDISERALEIARENARRLKSPVRFERQDIFTYSPRPESFDIIVSNPPYIPEEEKEGMERNVLEHEPAEALFVPDAEPLLYYSRIAEVARESLVPDGRLYLEINPRFAEELVNLLDHQNFRQIAIKKDISHRQRFLTATR